MLTELLLILGAVYVLAAVVLYAVFIVRRGRRMREQPLALLAGDSEAWVAVLVAAAWPAVLVALVTS